MMKQLIAMLLVLALVLSFTACTEKGQTEREGAQQSAEGLDGSGDRTKDDYKDFGIGNDGLDAGEGESATAPVLTD